MLEPLRPDVNFVSSSDSIICSLHSMNGKPTSEHPYPELFAYYNFKESRKFYLCFIWKKKLIHFSCSKYIEMIFIFLYIYAWSIGMQKWYWISRWIKCGNEETFNYTFSTDICINIKQFHLGKHKALSKQRHN